MLSSVSERRIQLVNDGKLSPMGTGAALFSSSTSRWSGFLLEKPKSPPENHVANHWTCNDVVMLHLGRSIVKYNVGSKSHHYVQRAGSILISPRNYEYTDATCSDVQPGDRLAVELDRSMLTRLLKGSDDHGNIRLAHHDGLHDTQISTLMRLMEIEVAEGCPNGSLYGQSLSVALLSHLISRYSVKTNGRGFAKSILSKQKLQLVLDYMYSRFDDNISLSELSSLIPTSAYHFCRLFRDATGVTPHRYLLGVRIEQAKRLLQDPKLSIAEVGASLGFANQSHFARTFKRITGVSPRRYRGEKILD